MRDPKKNQSLSFQREALRNERRGGKGPQGNTGPRIDNKDDDSSVGKESVAARCTSSSEGGESLNRSTGKETHVKECQRNLRGHSNQNKTKKNVTPTS